MSVQQPGGEALITDEKVAQSLWEAHAGLEQEAIAAVRAEGLPDAADAAVVRFSGETHDVTVTVQESQLAPRGLLHWLRRKPARINAWATVEDHANPTQPPVQVYLDAAHTGHYLLEPTISGTYVTQPEIVADESESELGEFMGVLEYALGQADHRQPPVTSTVALRQAVDVIRTVQTTDMFVSVEAPGEQLSDVAFVGNEVRQAQAIVDPFIANFRGDVPQLTNQDVLNGDVSPALRLTNELQTLVTGCAITVEIDAVHTVIRINPGDSDVWRDLPVLHITAATDIAQRVVNNFVFLDGADRVYPLTRMQRQQLTMLLAEELQPFKFDIVTDEQATELPDETVLAACEKLAGAIGEPDPRSYSWVVEIDDAMVGRTLAIQRTAQGFTVTAMQNGGIFCAVCISNGGFSAWQGTRPASPRAILELYDAIRGLAA
jgi:hypothetical protein